MSLLNNEHYLAKIEGHGSLKINLKESRAKLKINEGERLFEALLLGHPYSDGPFVTSRICGVCPIAHTLASIKALEKALDIDVDENSQKLRKIMLASQIIQSHVLHLFFFALPDYLGTSNSLELIKSKPEIFQMGLNLRKFGDIVTTIIGGRSVHPINMIVGGFSQIPDKCQLQKIRDEAKEKIKLAQECVKLFSSFKYPRFSKKTNYLSLVNGQNYEIYDGKIETSDNYIFDGQNYQKEIKEKTKLTSPAKCANYDGKPMEVGAIARISLHKEYLNYLARKSLLESKIEFPVYNTFYNNLAQAVEILHFLEETIKLCDELLTSNIYQLSIINYQLKSGKGVGVVEAPRGLLYHYYELDKNGFIKNCDIITPTNQNLSNIEQEAEILLKTSISANKSEKIIAKEVEMLIRAYDPCITCSVH